MDYEKSRQIATQIINKELWWDILTRFIDVLRINIFIADTKGHIILPPERGRYGGKLLTDPAMNFDFISTVDFIGQFEKRGKYLESFNRFELNNFALPINIAENNTIAYMIVGPVIFNRRLENFEYQQMAKEYGVNANDLLDEINSLRVVSNVMMSSILDLLSEIIKTNIALSVKKSEDKTSIVSQLKEDISSSVRFDELLISLLDAALQMTDSECGSVMVIDDDKGDLIIKVSRGLESVKADNARLKIGEGIAGLAFKENTSFFIGGKKTDNRISHLLKRPEIKKSFIMPLKSKDKVFGVLNIHTKKEKSRIEENIANLQYLSSVMSCAV